MKAGFPASPSERSMKRSIFLKSWNEKTADGDVKDEHRYVIVSRLPGDRGAARGLGRHGFVSPCQQRRVFSVFRKCAPGVFPPAGLVRVRKRNRHRTYSGRDASALSQAFDLSGHNVSRISKVEEDRFQMEYCLVSHRLNAVAADGGGTIVTFNYADGKKVAIPEAIRQRIERLESRGL